MKAQELLITKYDSLDMQQRAAAIEEARRAGVDFAKNDSEPFVCNCAEPHMPHRCPRSASFKAIRVSAQDYLSQVVEPALQSVEDEDAIEKDDDFSIDDPRVAAFVKSAQDTYELRLESLSYDEESGWTED